MDPDIGIRRPGDLPLLRQDEALVQGEEVSTAITYEAEIRAEDGNYYRIDEPHEDYLDAEKVIRRFSGHPLCFGHLRMTEVRSRPGYEARITILHA